MGNIKKRYSLLLLLTYLSSLAFSQDNGILTAEYQTEVIQFLKKNLTIKDFENIDLNKSYFSEFDNGRNYFLRIPFKDKLILNDFIALQTDSLGNCSKGSILHFKRAYNNNPYNDSLYLYDLQKTKNWIIYLNNPSNLKNTKESNKNKLLDPVIILTSNKSVLSYYFNVFALLNPSKIQHMETGFGVPPKGLTSGGFGTFSLYFDIDENKNNFSTSLVKIEFERPENLSPTDLKKMLE